MTTYAYNRLMSLREQTPYNFLMIKITEYKVHFVNYMLFTIQNILTSKTYGYIIQTKLMHTRSMFIHGYYKLY